jgi:hypothetical protein
VIGLPNREADQPIGAYRASIEGAISLDIDDSSASEQVLTPSASLGGRRVDIRLGYALSRAEP